MIDYLLLWVYRLGNRSEEAIPCIYRDLPHVLAADRLLHTIRSFRSLSSGSEDTLQLLCQQIVPNQCSVESGCKFRPAQRAAPSV
jgi:hypothetical protein